MPKYCTAPNCKNDSENASDRKSFYKYPLHDPVRLQQWLKNMGRDDWLPSRHQYICHEHFTAACFKLRWGIRYLENDAVPTVFSVPEKRKGMDHSEKKSKRLCYNSNLRIAVSNDEMPLTDATELDGSINTVQLYEITVDPSQSAETMLVETSDGRNSVEFLQTTALTAALSQPVLEDGLGVEADFPLTLFQTVENLSRFDGEENTEVLVVSGCPPVEGQEEMVSGITAALLTQGLVVNDATLGDVEEGQTSLLVQDLSSDIEEPSVVRDDHGTPVIAYFETIPNVLPNGVSAQLAISPDTVLSSALGSKPIVSTVPIVSKHMPTSPTSLVLTMERLETEVGEGERTSSEEDGGAEQQDNQLEEHCYHKNSLSKEQLEAIVAELQKKVKVLQQRHRRHLEKLLGLENTVSQLRQSNLLNEERLQLLERAYIQTSAAVSEAGETVAIIYEDDSAAYLYATSNDGEEEEA